MMDQIAVQSAVSVLERVDVDEAEVEGCGGENRIEVLCRAAVEGSQAVDQRRQIFVSGADMIGDRCARQPIMLADEATLGAQAEMDEARVADDDALQPLQFGAVYRPAAGFTDHLAPALDAILRRIFSLDLEARARILEQQECSGACKQVRRHFGDQPPRFVAEPARNERLECGRAEDHRAEG
ncbi:hypothetical protein D9M68_839370 [compost metagenome]